MIFLKSVEYFLQSTPKCHWRYLSSLNLWTEEISSKIKHQIEDHWKNTINQNISFDETEKTKEKYYVLSMFPYPSGSLHMGHVRVYTISDAIARFHRLNGKNVIHPIGWDAFGLPAENAAIERNTAPEEWTRDNISKMKSQLIELGCSFEWDRELSTCDPQYYHWTQELFLKLFEAGLVYQKEALVNWDPIDQTVLADEQVDENGCSWRSGAKVEKKLLKQWFIRTTRFAKDLLDGLDDSVLHDWKDIIKLQQHWIGECNGVTFDFKIVGQNNALSLWTSTPEFVKHIKFVAVSNSHILAQKEGINVTKGSQKLSVELENPFNSETIPVFVTSEMEFQPLTDSYVGIPGICDEAASFADVVNVKYLSLRPTDITNVDKLCEEAQKRGIGGYWTSANLRDWLISRQRYWGTPIPIINCKHCGPQPVPRHKLPVELPKKSTPSNRGHSVLFADEWVNAICPKCSKPAKRETDTMDTFVDSSWYYLRYLDNKNEKQMFDVQKTKQMMPVDLYIGGKEHATLHLYYARFISHFLHTLNLLPEREPFKRLLVQGMVMGRSYKVKSTGQYLPENEVEILDLKKNKAISKATGEQVIVSWEKMSKSKHNGVDPGDMLKQYGTDTTRLLILADVAPTSHRNWNSNTFPGILNWQKRLWLTIREFLAHRHNLPEQISEDQFRAHDDYLFDSRNYYLKCVTFNYCISQQHSIAISKQQGLTNSLRKSPPAVYAFSPQFERALATQIILLAPMAPHFASELWAGFTSAPNRLLSDTSVEICWNKPVLEQQWPKIDNNYNLDLACQVNGDEVCTIKIPKCDFYNVTKEEAIRMAMDHNEIQKDLCGKTILNIEHNVYDDYEIVVNIKTNFVKAAKEKKKANKKR